MKTSQKLSLKLSETRERLNHIGTLEGDDYSPEVRAEEQKLQESYPTLERRYRSALIGEGGQDNGKLDQTDTKGRKLRSLVGKASLVNYLSESVTQNEVRSGSAEAELRSELLGKNAQPGQVPLAVLAPSAMDKPKRQTRATDTATDVADTVAIPNRQNAIIRRVFAAECHFVLGHSNALPRNRRNFVPVLERRCQSRDEEQGCPCGCGGGHLLG